MSDTMLLSPLTIRGVTLRNRVVISPMCQYSATDGMAEDFHLVHLGQFALGGAGMIFSEAVAVHPNGRITHGDIGLWEDRQVAPLRRITDFLRRHGAVPAIQISHAGRKASMQRPWYGNGPLTADDLARGDHPWPVVAPSPLPMDAGWLMPTALSGADMGDIRGCFRRAALRALEAGFEVVEVHGAHGYLLHQFLSPLSNHRSDGYGGDLAGRMRFPLEVAEAVRAAWPDDKPVFFRVSAVDGVEGGWTLDESVTLARELKARGIDVMDCSSGGLTGPATAARLPRGPGFQVPFAARIRQDADIATMAVGLITQADQAEEILRSGDADLIAIGREALFDPHWPLHAEQTLGQGGNFASWPVQYGWWLDRRARTMPGKASAR